MGKRVYGEWRKELLFEYETTRAKQTWMKMRQVTGEFGELPCVKTTEDLTRHAIIQWLAAHPERSRSAAHSLLRSFRRAVRVGLSCEYLTADPFKYTSVSDYVKNLRKVVRVKAHLSREEIGRVLAHVERSGLGDWPNHRLFALVAVLAHTGVRRNEALFLRVADVNFERGFVWVRGTKTEEADAPVPLSPELADVLRVWLPRTDSPYVFPTLSRTSPWTGGPTGQQPLHRLRDVAKEAGIDGLTFQAMRHSFATHAAYWGIGPNDLRKILRHTTERTQRHYLEIDLENLGHAVRSIRYLPSRGPRPDRPPPAADGPIGDLARAAECEIAKLESDLAAAKARRAQIFDGPPPIPPDLRATGA
jgi:integrase